MIRRRGSGGYWLLSAYLTIGVFAPAAHASDAKDGRTAYADHLFREGVRLMKDDNCPDAISKFLASQQLDSSAGTLVNLATCYARLSRTASAWRTYQKAAIAAGAENNAELKEKAFKAISILAPTLTKLRIIPPRASRPLSLTVNGEPTDLEDGVPIALDPGENVIEAVAPGHQPWRRNIHSTELGATIVVEVPELAPASSDEPSADWRTPAVIVGGAGVAAIVAGSLLGFSAMDTYEESSRYCRDDHCNATGNELRQSALSRAAWSSYVIGAGSAITAAGLVLWFTSPSRKRNTVGMAPWVINQADGGGLLIRGNL